MLPKSGGGEEEEGRDEESRSGRGDGVSGWEVLGVRACGMYPGRCPGKVT